MQFAANDQTNWQQGYCFIMTMPDPITGWKVNGRNQPWPNLSYYPGTSWKEMKNHLSQDIWSLGQDVNSGCQKYTVEALPT
jgi:hypothetical protein